MSIKITIPNSSSDVLTFGSGNTPTAAQIAGIDSGSSNGQLALYTTASGTSTERVRINASGNVGIGTTSPGYRLDVRGGNARIAANASGASDGVLYFGNAATNYIFGGDGNNYMTFGVNNAERMRIDSSGNLLVGTTSRYSTEKASIYSASGTDCGLVVQNLGGSGNNGIRSIIATGGNNTSTAHFQGTTNGVSNWYLYGNGTTSYSSDARLKKNIETTRDGYIDDVMKLRVVKYNWKNSEDGTPKELGMIAQEIEEVFPNLVQDDLSPISDEDPIRYKQVKWSVLPFILLKALQEQQAIITSLTDRITALENK